MKLALLISLFLVAGSKVQARVFDYRERHLAAVISGSFGSTLMGQEGFAANKGAGVEFSDQYQFLTSGKLGFSFGLGDKVHMVLALEMLKPFSVKGVQGQNSSAETLYDFSSSARVMNPLMEMEYVSSQWGLWRSFFFGGVGWGQLVMDNEFKMTPTGSTELGVGSYTEKLKGSALNGVLGFGFETHFVDAATFVFKVGHRLFKFYELNHGSEVTTVAEGSVVPGDVVHNADGSKRQLDMSGSFVELGFRFYIP